jgi:hypothetical protein
MLIDDLDPEAGNRIVMIGTWTEPTAITLLEAAIPNVTHLKPLWERIRVLVVDDRAWVGLPITAKVTDENADNHARHLYSLLNLLGVPLAASPMSLERHEADPEDLAPLFYLDPKVEKEKEKRRLAEEAALAEAALAEAALAEGEGGEAAESTD